MIFKAMKVEDVRKALEGQVDALKSVYDTMDKFFKTLACPKCKSEVLAVVNAKTPFREGSIVPNYLAKCKACGLEFEPYTGIIVSLTNY